MREKPCGDEDVVKRLPRIALLFFVRWKCRIAAKPRPRLGNKHLNTQRKHYKNY